MTEKEFIDKWSEKISGELSIFPSDYGDPGKTRVVKFDEKTLKLGSEFFGGMEIINSNGEPVYLAKDYDEAKFILYAFRFSKEIEIPEDENLMREIIKNYERKLDEFVHAVNKDFGLYFSDKSTLLEITNKIFRRLNLQRH